MSLTPGTQLGPYEVARQLGSGGMGVVYEARDPRLKRTVAIKLLPPDLTSDETAKQRFLQEAQAASALDHPNICTIYDVGETDDGQLYLVMAHYEGETLKERIARGPIAVDEAVDIATQVGRGLAKAHAAGIVHRDIKPANLMVTTDGTVKILDFGLAKLAGLEGVTQTGTTVGTVAYMSPEQARGQEVDHRTDIWSLGVVLYEMLAGEPPFQGENLLSLAEAIRSGEPGALKGDASSVRGAVARSLAKGVGNRYQTVAVLLEDLTANGTATVPSAGGSDVPSIAVLPFTNLSADAGQEYFSDGLTDEVIADLSKIRDLRVVSRTSVMQLKGSRKDLRTIAHDLDVRYLLEGSVRRAGNNLRITAQLIDAATDTHLWAEKYSGTLDDVFDIQERVSRAIFDELRIRLGPDEDRQLGERPIADLEAYECYLRAQHEIWLLTDESLQKALDYLEQGLAIAGENGELYAAKSFALTTSVNVLSPPSSSLASVLEQAQECAMKALAINPNSASAHYAQGWVHAQRGAPRQAVKHWREAARLEPNHGGARTMLSYWLAASGDFPGSRRNAETARHLDPLNPVSASSRGFVPLFNGEFATALAEMQSWQQAAEYGSSPFVVLFAWIHAANDDMGEADRLIDVFVEDRPGHVVGELMSFLRFAWRGQGDDALGAVTDRLETAAWWDDLYSLFMADGCALVGDLDRSIFWLDHTVDYGIASPRFLGECDPFLASLRSDERFKALIDKARRVSESVTG